MRGRIIRLIMIFALGLFAEVMPADTQQMRKMSRIGYLAATSPSTNVVRIEAFRQGLRELGYEEGKNIAIEWRWAEGKADRLPGLAAELVRLKVDTIVTGGSTATRAAKKATDKIPIIMSQDNDPIGNGFVASLARPGGNITGLATLRTELSGKRLELLKEIVPKLSRVAVVGTSTNPGNTQSLKETELAGAAFGVKLQYLDVLGPKDIETIFLEASSGGADAVLLLASPILNARRSKVVKLAIESRLPVIYDRREFTNLGGLLSYGTTVSDLSRRAAIYVDKILKGAKAAELPVEQPTQFDLVINLKTAKQLGITIPPTTLYRATKIIR